MLENYQKSLLSFLPTSILFFIQAGAVHWQITWAFVGSFLSNPLSVIFMLLSGGYSAYVLTAHSSKASDYSPLEQQFDPESFLY